MSAITFLGAVLIGMSLGLTGAGGSIITLPVLVYFAGIPPKEAVGMSLFVVGSAALVGALQRFRTGDVHMKAALIFILTGIIGAAAGAQITPFVSTTVLMLIFSTLLLTVAANMLLGKNQEPKSENQCRVGQCVSAGFGVGVLTGFIGVGGGFLLMPALVKFANLPLRSATGTSLAIITFNSAAGFLSHLGTATPRWTTTLLFSGLAIAGVVLGSSFAKKLPIARLRQVFAILVLGTGGYIFWAIFSG